jgi:hypothetical protein
VQNIQFYGIIFTPTKETKMSISDTINYQDKIATISKQFIDDMLTLHSEEPEMFKGRSTLEEWSNQVWNAKLELEERIAEQVEIVEILLHDGNYTHQFKA